MSAVVIPARYESTRFPGKPLADIAGVPMIVRVAVSCLKSKADRVIVATDDIRILQVCEKLDGLESTMTDPNLPTGTDRVAKVSKFIEDEIIINVQGDEPFIDPALINAMIDDLEKNPDVNMNTAVTKFGDDEDINDPNSVKAVVSEDGRALYFSRAAVPFDRDKKGEAVYFRHIGIYGFRRKFLAEFAAMPESALEKVEKLEQLRALEAGQTIRVVKTDYKPISVDSPEDIDKCVKFLEGLKNG